MTKTIMTMIVFASSACLGFANQGEINTPILEKHSAIEQGDTVESETTSIPPVLEKCKKKKK